MGLNMSKVVEMFIWFKCLYDTMHSLATLFLVGIQNKRSKKTQTTCIVTIQLLFVVEQKNIKRLLCSVFEFLQSDSRDSNFFFFFLHLLLIIKHVNKNVNILSTFFFFFLILFVH